MVNVLSGGLHAEGGLEIQDFLVVPVGAETYGGRYGWVYDLPRIVFSWTRMTDLVPSEERSQS